ncbi:acyltransferase [Ferruginibacter lapsinanis]|uniref:acyltransferase family protein n=1 Tax=Ferruginibacter lapsinanis TaxID=563172 RepID=UPI001E64895A|nr:acyltransferase [Ferruginibacter lapsinanis]UEG49460.1 acyltransferase [Ferruginibacter lapsinanis]
MQENNKKFSLGHLPELDALRTFAVLLTMVAHLLPAVGFPLIPYTWYGVEIFFTISGFLITTILILSLQKQAESKLMIIKKFMIRRLLRLFPIYYLFLLLFWGAKHLLHIAIWQDIFTPYFFSYTPNFLIYQVGFGAVACFSHLWSLGVEEQFYLFWPWVLLFTPSKYRLKIIIAMVLVSLVAYFLFFKDARLHVLPFANFHTLGMGALLAVFYVDQGAVINWLKDRRQTVFLITLLNLLVVLFFYTEGNPFLTIYRELSLCISTFSFVLMSIFGWKGWVKFLSTNKAIQYIGTISYGIYLFHMVIPVIFQLILGKVAPGLHIPSVPLLIIYFGLTFVTAYLSYRFIETPFLKLKLKFS